MEFLMFCLLMRELKRVRKEVKKARKETQRMSQEIDALKQSQETAFAAVNSGLDNISEDLNAQAAKIQALTDQLANGNLSDADKAIVADLATQAQAIADRVSQLKEVVSGN